MYDIWLPASFVPSYRLKDRAFQNLYIVSLSSRFFFNMMALRNARLTSLYVKAY